MKNSKLIDAAPAKNDRPRETLAEYFSEANQNIIVRRGELNSILDTWFKVHLFREHRPWWSHLYLWVRATLGRPVDPLASKRITAEEQEAREA